MDVSPDEVAGVVDLFGGLTPGELARALAELAYKRGAEYDLKRYEPAVDDALGSYHLVRLDRTASGTDGLLVAGPAAFPDLPQGGRDLLHILDVEPRETDREAATLAAVERFHRDVTVAVERGDSDRVATLLDVSYELETWGSVDLSRVRDRLSDHALG